MLRDDGEHSIEKSADMSELRLQSIVVRSVLPHEATVVLAVLLEILGSFLLGHVSIALLADPGDEVPTGLQGGVPGLSKEVVIAALEVETHLTLLVQGRNIEVEGRILEE